MWDGVFNDQISDPGISASPDYFTVSSYGYFSPLHLLTIGLAFVILGALFFVFFRRKNIEKWVLLGSTLTVVMCILATVVYAASTGIYNLEWFVPLHICNLFGIILPLCMLNKKIKKFCLDYIVWFGMGGGILAIVFPITSAVYLGVLHPISIIVYIHHIVLAALSVYYISSGIYRYINAFKMLCFLAFLMAGAALVNHLTGANFLFFNPARAVEPLTTFNLIFGPYGVLVAWGLISAMLIGIHFLFRYFYKRRTLTVKQFFMQNWFIRKVAASKTLMEGLDSLKKLVTNTASDVNKEIANKNARKIISLAERFVKVVKDSGILVKLFDTKLGELTDADYLVDTFNDSGLLKKLCLEFNATELQHLKELPLDDVLMLNGRQGNVILLPAGA